MEYRLIVSRTENVIKSLLNVLWYLKHLIKSEFSPIDYYITLYNVVSIFGCLTDLKLLFQYYLILIHEQY
jgi:hypothetical protein